MSVEGDVSLSGTVFKTQDTGKAHVSGLGFWPCFKLFLPFTEPSTAFLQALRGIFLNSYVCRGEVYTFLLNC